MRAKAADCADIERKFPMIVLTLKLDVRKVYMPDGTYYFSLFNEEGDKVAPWSDSDSLEELLECLKLECVKV